MTATVPAAPAPLSLTTLPEPTSRLSRFFRRAGWPVGVALLLVVLLLWRASQVPKFGAFEVRTVTAGTMSLAFLAMAQAVIVISGGIDLSVGSMMVFTNCLAARWMEGQDFATCVVLALLVVGIAVVISSLIGGVITMSGIPDIVVTLAASFILSGLALFVLESPGGGIDPGLQRRMVGGFSEPWPSVLWILGALVLIWLPLKRSRVGIAIYAVGSDRSASFLSGVRIGRVRVAAYSLGGFFAGTAGIITTAFTGSGEPRASIGANVTLNSVAAVVLGGVVLSGGAGGLVGPVLAAMCLTLIPAIMLGLGWDPSYAETARGILIILVVMVGGLLQARRRRT
jgi:ribose transport system permease protein